MAKQTDATCFLCIYRCFLLSLANFCLVWRTHAGMRNTLGISLPTHTGQTHMDAIRDASEQFSSTWGTLSMNICFITTGNSTACGAFLISISLVSQSAAQQTCTIDWSCTRTSSSQLSKSHTGGPANDLVSKEHVILSGTGTQPGTMTYVKLKSLSLFWQWNSLSGPHKTTKWHNIEIVYTITIIILLHVWIAVSAHLVGNLSSLDIDWQLC